MQYMYISTLGSLNGLHAIDRSIFSGQSRRLDYLIVSVLLHYSIETCPVSCVVF